MGYSRSANLGKTGYQMSAELKVLVKELGLLASKLTKVPSGGIRLIGPDFDVCPEEFLEQAENDYEAGGNALMLNAISNAKRAINCQIAQALVYYGFNIETGALKSEKKRRELFEDLGFLAPRILRRVADARNILEHEYRLPTSQQVEDALDLAALFIEATGRNLDIADTEFALGNEDEQIENRDFFFTNQLDVVFEPEEMHFQIQGRRGIPEDARRPLPVLKALIITRSDPVYTDLVRLTVAGDRPARVEHALDMFWASLEELL